MTQEQKELLLKDICARLPYGIKGKILETDEVKILGSIQYDGENTLFDFWEDDQKIQYGHQLYLSEFKPCLFPLLSMTREQEREWQSLMVCDIYGIFYHTIESFDYLYKNHIDIRGLIPMGLAIDATGKNIY